MPGRSQGANAAALFRWPRIPLVSNDGPTLIGANASFSVALHFPKSQKVLPNGQVSWANNTIINGEYLSTSFPRFRILVSPVSPMNPRNPLPFSSSLPAFFFFFTNYICNTYSLQKNQKTQIKQKEKIIVPQVGHRRPSGHRSWIDLDLNWLWVCDPGQVTELFYASIPLSIEWG